MYIYSKASPLPPAPLKLVIYNFQGLLSATLAKNSIAFYSFSWISTFWEVIFEVPGIVFGGLGGTRDHLGLQGDPGSIFWWFWKGFWGLFGWPFWYIFLKSRSRLICWVLFLGYVFEDCFFDVWGWEISDCRRSLHLLDRVLVTVPVRSARNRCLS